MDNIKSDEYNDVYNYFKNMNINDPKYNKSKTLEENIQYWICECVLGRGMFGRDLEYWFDKFNNRDNWIILEMKYVLKNPKITKDVMKVICRFAGIDDIDNDKDFQDWIPKTMKLNQNNVKYQPPKRWKQELIDFYKADQEKLYQFIKNHRMNYIYDDKSLAQLVNLS